MESLGRPDRKVVAIACHVDAGSHQTRLTLADLGFGGGFVAGQAEVQRGDRILVTFSLGDAELQCAARVAHVQPSRGFGFAFYQDELSEDARLALERYLRHE